MAQRTVAVNLVASVGQYQSAMTQAAASTRGVGDSATKATTQARTGFEAAGRGAQVLAGIVGGALVVGFKSAIDAAAKAEQSIGGAQAVFKQYGQDVIAASEEADVALGLSANSYRELATVIGSQMKNAGVPLDRLAGQTQDIIGVGADLAAQFGGSTQQAVEALSSAFRGELDPIERYGISLTAASVGAKAVELGLASSSTNVSANAKAMATLALITEQSADAQGAFSRETDTASHRAEVAAAQWENLKVQLGDQLLPAWSSLVSIVSNDVIPALGAVIDMGSGVVEFFGALPGPVLATIGALGGLAILNGPLSGVLATVKGFGGNLFGGVAGTTSAFGEALGYARQNGDGLGTVLRSVGGYAGGQLKAGLGGLVSLFGGPWGIALAGAAAGVSYVTSTMEDADKQTQDWTQSILNGTAAADGLNEAYLAQYGGEKPDWLQQQSELLGFTSSLEDAEAGARELYDAMDPLAQAQQNVTYDTNRLVEAIDKFGENSPEAQQAADLLAESNNRLAGRQDAVTRATDAAEAALAESNGTVADAAEETETYSEMLSAAGTQLDELIASLEYLSGAQVTLAQAQNDVNSAVLDATEKFDENGGSVVNAAGQLDQYTRNGIEAYDRLVAMAEANNTLIGTMEQQGQTSEVVTAKDGELRESFIVTAEQMGLSREAAEVYADQILGIPEERTTQIEANTQTASERIANIARAVFGLPDGNVDVNANTAPADGAIAAFVARVTGTRVTLTGDFVGGSGVVVRKAQGGAVWGAGSATSDSIPAMLSNGEYVVKASSVSKYGLAALDAVNAGRLEDIAHFAEGGLARSYAVPVGIAGLDNISVSLAAMADVASTIAGPAGSSAIGGTWTSIFNAVKNAIPAARQNSTFRRGDPGYHGKNKAVDFGYGSGPGGTGSAGLASINRFLYDNYGSKLAELIYDGIGDDRPDIKNGRPHTYNAATRAQHANHVHAANYRDGGLIGMPQYKQGTPFVPNDGPAYLHKGEAVIPKFANGGMVKLGDVSDAVWDGLLSAGWKGRQGDSMEALYAPASREFSGASSAGSSGSSASQAFPDGMRISGMVQFDPSRGMIQFVDARVFNGASEMTRIATGRGF